MANDVVTAPDEPRPRRNKIALATEKFGNLHAVAAKRAAMLDVLHQKARLTPEDWKPSTSHLRRRWLRSRCMKLRRVGS